MAGLEDWYLHKALECGRLAGETADPGKRKLLHEEAEIWRDIARDIARQERNKMKP